MSPADTCPDCGAPIQWARRSDGSVVRLDRDPADNGTVRVHERGDSPNTCHTLAGKQLDAARRAGWTLHRYHRQACPEAPAPQRREPNPPRESVQIGDLR